MNLGLINSAWAQTGRETAYGIQKTRTIGFDTIDIFVDPLDSSKPELQRIREECDRAGLPIVSVACVALGLVDFNPSVQMFHMNRVYAYLDTVKLFGARNLLLVLGEYLWQQEVIPPHVQWETGVQNVRKLGDYAAGLGLEIALEMEPFQQSLLKDVECMDRFLTDVDKPSVKANIDISHMVLAGQLPETLEILRGRVAHVHISDCDGKVHGDLPPGRGVVEFMPYLEVIRGLEIPDATISVELEYSPDPNNIEAWVAEAYEATARLMQLAGLRP